MLPVADDAGARRTAKRGPGGGRRRALGLTQEDLAAHLGIERSTVARWETGATQPLPSIRPRLAKALQVPSAQLAGPPGALRPARRRAPAARRAAAAAGGGAGISPAGRPSWRR